jgi:hypothetical protein
MNDLDLDGIEIDATIDLNGGSLSYIEDSATVAANISLSVPDLSGVKVDAITPVIQSISFPASQTYYAGDIIEFNVQFSEVINVINQPLINIDMNGSVVAALYHSGSGTNTLKFRRTVAQTDLDLSGIAIASPVSLDTNGSIKDVAGNNANLAFLPPNLSGVVVNGVVPVITSVVKPNNGVYLLGQSLNFNIVFNKNVFVSGAPQIALDIGGVALNLVYQSGSGSNSLTFSYDIVSGEQDTNGTSISGPIDLNGGSIMDADSNSARLSFSVPDLSAVLVQAIEPVITSIVAPANGNYATAQNLEFTLNFSENVVITSSPRLALTVGAQTVYANYLEGSGTSAIKFRYTVAASDTESNAIILSSPIQLNAGLIADASGNNASLTFTPAANTILVNAGTPELEFQDLSGNPISFYDFGTPGANTSVTVRVKNIGTATSGVVSVVRRAGSNTRICLGTNACTTTLAVNATCNVTINWANNGGGGLRIADFDASATPGNTTSINVQGTK